MSDEQRQQALYWSVADLVEVEGHSEAALDRQRAAVKVPAPVAAAPYPVNQPHEHGWWVEPRRRVFPGGQGRPPAGTLPGMSATGSARGMGGAPRTPGIGCQLNNWQRELNFREPAWDKLDTALAQLVDAGFAGVEVPSWSVPNLAAPQRLRELCAKHGVTLVSLHVGGPLHDAAAYEARTVPAVTTVATCAASAGASGVVFSGQTLRGRLDTFGTDQGRTSAAWQAQTRHLGNLGRRCHDLGARLFFHNHDPQFEHDAWEMESVLAADPSVVELCVDVGHAAQAMPPDRLLAWLLDHWDRVGCLHYKDIDGQRRLVESLGDGVVDFGAISRLALEHRFAGWIVAELDSGRADPTRGVAPRRPPLEDARRSAALIARTLGR